VAKKVGFVGNCQLGTLSSLYGRLLGDDADIEVFYLPSYKAADAEQRALVGSADVIVRQVLDFKQEIGALDTDAVVHLFPLVTCSFLWPFTGKAHPLNKAFPYFDESGPYPAELGDIYMNKMIADGIAPERAISAYLDAELPALQRLDRLAEMFLDKQRARDKACGYNFADFIESRFRTESLFRSPNHPEVPLTMMMAASLFERLEMDSAVIAQAVAIPPDRLFPITATPIHPYVAETFGLTFAGAQTRYRYFDEGRFTFEEYCGRYMRFEWNPKLAEGLYWYRNKEIDKAVEALEEGIAASPRSAIGRSVLGDLLATQNRLVEAVQRARGAVAIEPDNPHFRHRLDYLVALRPAPIEEEPVLGSNLIIDFGRGGNARKFLDQGWGATESGFTWTTSHRASLKIKKATADSGYIMSFSVAPFAPRERPYQRCSVLLNDISLAELHIDRAEEHSVWIPSDVVSEITGEMTIVFELPDAARPADYADGNADDRQLGLAFKRLTLDRLDSITS
jgi:tetratricopeptide (TPR) repeat protein